MSRISIASAIPVADLAFAKYLHQRLKLSLLKARELLNKGEQGFFYGAELYGNDHVQREQEIRDIIAFFGERQAPLVFLETDPEQPWVEPDPETLKALCLPQEEIINLLDASRGLYE